MQEQAGCRQTGAGPYGQCSRVPPRGHLAGQRAVGAARDLIPAFPPSSCPPPPNTLLRQWAWGRGGCGQEVRDTFATCRGRRGSRVARAEVCRWSGRIWPVCRGARVCVHAPMAQGSLFLHTHLQRQLGDPKLECLSPTVTFTVRDSNAGRGGSSPHGPRYSGTRPVCRPSEQAADRGSGVIPEPPPRLGPTKLLLLPFLDQQAKHSSGDPGGVAVRTPHLDGKLTQRQWEGTGK